MKRILFVLACVAAVACAIPAWADPGVFFGPVTRERTVTRTVYRDWYYRTPIAPVIPVVPVVPVVPAVPVIVGQPTPADPATAPVVVAVPAQTATLRSVLVVRPRWWQVLRPAVAYPIYVTNPPAAPIPSTPPVGQPTPAQQ